jgi:hypothetical protein
MLVVRCRPGRAAAGIRKALSLSNLRFVMRAYIQRDYSKVVFFELVVQSLDGCRHFSVSIGGSVSPPW